MNSKVFISYSQVDGLFTQWLVDSLQTAQVNVWWDANEVFAGDYMREQIQKGISPSSVFVLVVSQHSVKSDWVRFELNSALMLNAVKNNIQILIIKLDQTPIPSDLQGIIYIDASASTDIIIPTILDLLKRDQKPAFKFEGWDGFSAKTFGDLITDLLQAEHRTVTRFAPTRDYGVDMVIDEINSLGANVKIFVQVKFYKETKIGIQVIREMSGILHSNNVPQGLLITNSELTMDSRRFLATHGTNIVVWEGHQLITKLAAYPELFRKYLPGATLLSEPIKLIDEKLTAAQDMIQELEYCPEGLAGWKRYEDICIKILNHLFVPPLNTPKIQVRRESGIDIRDAIYPNRGLDDNWRFIREDYDAKYIVVEFKNYSKVGNEIDKHTVLQIDDYLKKKTIGRFGIICSKKEPSHSALEKRKDVFTESNKLILFLNNHHLKDMILRKYNGLEPFDILSDLIDDFNLKF